MQDILDSGTHSDLLAAAQLLKSYNGALQHQVSRHQYAVHILQVLLKEQVMIPHHCHCCYFTVIIVIRKACLLGTVLAGCMSLVVSLHVLLNIYYVLCSSTLL